MVVNDIKAWLIAVDATPQEAAGIDASGKEELVLVYPLRFAATKLLAESLVTAVEALQGCQDLNGATHIAREALASIRRDLGIGDNDVK